MIRTAWPHDLPALRALFARANDAPYDLAAVAEEKCFGPGFGGSPVVRVFEEDDRIVGASVTCGRWLRILAVDRAARRRRIGSSLLADAESRDAAVIAAEPGNYFTPGVVDTDSAACGFFHARGYIETRWTHNLEVDLPSRTSASPLVRRARHDESDRVLDFIEREFGRIWRFEVSRAFSLEVPNVYVAEEGSQILGFAAHDVNNHGLGFFGPTGVAQALRGRGVGCQLLLASLADMERLGYSRAVVPWTDALEFYRKCSGAEAAHRFIAFAKPQP